MQRNNRLQVNENMILKSSLFIAIATLAFTAPTSSAFAYDTKHATFSAAPLSYADVLEMPAEELGRIHREVFRIKIRDLPKTERIASWKKRRDGRKVLELERKAYCKQLKIARAQAESARRKSVIAWRRSTGWYDMWRTGRNPGHPGSYGGSPTRPTYSSY